MNAPQSLKHQFEHVSHNKSKARKTSPFCIRFTEDERAYLESKADKRPLGAYCRESLLRDYGTKRRTYRKPGMDEKQHATLLAELGHLGSNINQMARHANMGTIEVSDNIEQELHDAYLVIIEMRKALFMALGLKTG